MKIDVEANAACIEHIEAQLMAIEAEYERFKSLLESLKAAIKEQTNV